MHAAIPTSADQGALPPGLAARAAPLLNPGEGLRWVGRGTRVATFLALAPGMALVTLVMGLFAGAFLTIDGWEYPGAGADLAGDIPPDVAARGVGFATAAILLLHLFRFARGVLGARRAFAFLTDRRLVLVTGRKARSVPLPNVARAEANRHHYGSSLAFELRGEQRRPGARPAVFGLSNVDTALAALEALGIAADDLRSPPEDSTEKPPPLASGERIRWSGRRGWHAADRSRLILIALGLPLLLPLLFALWWAWSIAFADRADLGDYVLAGMIVIAACLFVGPMAWGILRLGAPFLGDLLVDMFGTLAVTDRRILFVGPLGGEIDRDIKAARVVAADLVEEGSSGRGHIAVTLAGNEEGEVEILDLFGVPDAAAAAAAIARLVRR